MREWVDATCELGAHARFSIPEASEIAERGKGARGGDSTKKSSEEGEREREAMRKMDERRRTAGENLRRSNPDRRELYSFVYSLAYNYADDAE